MTEEQLKSHLLAAFKELARHQPWNTAYKHLAAAGAPILLPAINQTMKDTANEALIGIMNRVDRQVYEILAEGRRLNLIERQLDEIIAKGLSGVQSDESKPIIGRRVDANTNFGPVPPLEHPGDYGDVDLADIKEEPNP